MKCGVVVDPAVLSARGLAPRRVQTRVHSRLALELETALNGGVGVRTGSACSEILLGIAWGYTGADFASSATRTRVCGCRATEVDGPGQQAATYSHMGRESAVSDFSTRPRDMPMNINEKTVHVTPREDGPWSVVPDGAQRASSVHATQAEASSAGRDTDVREQTKLYIHGRDGQIRDRDSYGNDLHPLKG